MKRMVIDVTEAEYLSEADVRKAIGELTALDEYRGVFTWVSVLGDDGKVSDVIRR